MLRFGGHAAAWKLALALAVCLAAFSQTGSQERQQATQPNDNIAASRGTLEEQRASARGSTGLMYGIISRQLYRSEGERGSGTQQFEQAIALFREAPHLGRL